MSDDPHRAPLSLRIRLVLVALLWLSAALVFGPPELLEVADYESYRADYTGICGPHAPDIPARPCTREEYMAEYGAGFAGVGLAMIKFSWLGLVGLPVLLAWGLGFWLSFLYRTRPRGSGTLYRGELRSRLRSEGLSWAVGLSVQSSLNVLALGVLLWRSSGESGSWLSKVVFATLSVAMGQLLWFLPLLTLGLIVQPRLVPGLTAGAAFSGLLGLVAIAGTFAWMATL